MWLIIISDFIYFLKFKQYKNANILNLVYHGKKTLHIAHNKHAHSVTWRKQTTLLILHVKIHEWFMIMIITSDSVKHD